MKKIISITDLCYSIPYSDTILSNINFDIHEKEFIGILGHNGSGKTTLVDIIMGFRGPTSGSVQVLDENPQAMFRANKHQVVFLSQEVTLKSNITIQEFLNFQASFYPNYSKEDELHLLNAFSLSPESKIGSLSTGQQKKVQVVAGLSARPLLIVIDEITAVMDPETRQIFFNEIQGVREKLNSSIILATNIAEDLIDRADKILFVENKQAAFHAPSEISKLFNLTKAA